ncbi:MAG: hypothetical protein QOF49_130 [Chloroflexota bacterium]|nr:hypothetical protein [Chloroflexota bacterium]
MKRADPRRSVLVGDDESGGASLDGDVAGRDAMDMVTLLVDTWRAASAGETMTAALAGIADSVKRALDADSADVHVASPTAPPAEPPIDAVGTLSVPVVGLRGQDIATLTVARARTGGPFSAEEQAVVRAVALMAAIVIERSASDRNLRAVLEHSPAAIFLKDHDLRYVLGNRRAAEMLGLQSPAAMIGTRDSDFLPAHDAARIMTSDRTILAGAGDIDTEEPAHWPLEGRQLHVHAFAVTGEDGEPLGVGGVVTDVTAHRAADAALVASERRYRQLLEHALDAIVIADDDGRTIQVNRAMTALLGWSREELVGAKLADLIVRRDDGDDGERRWDGFRSRRDETQASKGYIRLRRRDLTICEVEYSAVANVEPGVHLGIFRDATERRQAERLTRQRQGILDALVRMPADSPLDDLAVAVCRAMVVPGAFPEVAILAVEPPSRIAIVGAAMDGDTRDAGLPPIVEGPRAEAIIARANAGAWVDDWSDPNGEPNRTLVEGLAIAAVAWAPIEADGRVIALLAVGGAVPAVEQEQRLSYLGDLASIVAGSTLGRSLREHAIRVATRVRIREVLETRAFDPVFQPIVDLESGAITGYEALTRFADRAAPDVVFAEAAAAGMSLELEVATARAALEAADPLPANRPININVSPELIMAREPLRTMLREWGFGVVLEITEHSQVSDYPALRAAIAEIGPQVELAVDDAGAGFSSLRHILELRPAVVKLDITLIRGIDADPARQALVAGMVHFAGRLEFTLLAEGVETEAEQATLVRLGVTRGQGYLFGRPAPVADWRRAR